MLIGADEMEKLAFDDHRSLFFDNLSETWDNLGSPPSKDRIMSFLSRLGIKPGDTVVDIGTGTGLLIPYIFEYQPQKVIAVDLSEKMLIKAGEKHGAAFGGRLILLRTDIHNLDMPDRSADVVICNGAYPHFHNKEQALAEMSRILHPGGVLAINHFAGKEFINSIHAGSSNQYIQQDLLDEVECLADQAKKAGFIVKNTIDNDSEYCLVADKP
jgi:ubiquinone/menaquinone biosynthesis C-methylase UbiE